LRKAATPRPSRSFDSWAGAYLIGIGISALALTSHGPRHLRYHPNTDEQVYVIEGVLSVYIDERWHELAPGRVGVLPRGKPHAQGNCSDKPIHFVGSGAPAGCEKLIPAVDAVMKRIKRRTPEFIAEFQQIVSRCDIVSLGPAPA
jgi:uncharacterized cupin superfamily protein